MMFDEVLVIDDNPSILFLHELMLVEECIVENPKLFSNPKKALDYIRGHKQLKLLIFLDINMPQMSGWELLEAIHQMELNENIQVIMVSSSISKADKLKAKEFSNILEYWEKPITESHCHLLKELYFE